MGRLRGPTGQQRVRFPGNDPASLLWNERGYEITDETYTSMQIDIHPNDLRKRVPPDGPYSQAWEGVQKINPVANVSTHYQNYQGMANPFQTTRLRTGTINQNNPTPGFFGSGPVTQAIQQQASLDYYQQANAAPPSLFRSIINRLRG